MSAPCQHQFVASERILLSPMGALRLPLLYCVRCEGVIEAPRYRLALCPRVNW